MEKEKNRSLQLEEKLKEREESWSGLEGRLRSETEQQKQRYSGKLGIFLPFSFVMLYDVPIVELTAMLRINLLTH